MIKRSLSLMAVLSFALLIPVTTYAQIEILTGKDKELKAVRKVLRHAKRLKEALNNKDQEGQKQAIRRLEDLADSDSVPVDLSEAIDETLDRIAAGKGAQEAVEDLIEDAKDIKENLKRQARQQRRIIRIIGRDQEGAAKEVKRRLRKVKRVLRYAKALKEALQDKDQDKKRQAIKALEDLQDSERVPEDLRDVIEETLDRVNSGKYPLGAVEDLIDEAEDTKEELKERAKDPMQMIIEELR